MIPRVGHDVGRRRRPIGSSAIIRRPIFISLKSAVFIDVVVIMPIKASVRIGVSEQISRCISVEAGLAETTYVLFICSAGAMSMKEVEVMSDFMRKRGGSRLTIHDDDSLYLMKSK